MIIFDEYGIFNEEGEILGFDVEQGWAVSRFVDKETKHSYQFPTKEEAEFFWNCTLISGKYPHFAERKVYIRELYNT